MHLILSGSKDIKFHPSWVEDGPVADRAIILWTGIVKVITYFLSLKKYLQPDNKFYATLVQHQKEELVIPRFCFFRFIANLLNAFLVKFQSDTPLVPFVSKSLAAVVRELLRIFIKGDVLQKATTPYKLIKIDVTQKENLVPSSQIRLDTATKAALNKATTTDTKKLRFKDDCIIVLTTLIQKLQNRCPLTSSIVWNSECLSPKHIIEEAPEASQNMFTQLVECLHTLKWLTADQADRGKRQFDEFLKVAHREEGRFVSFNFINDRLDEFYAPFLHKNKEYVDMWTVCRIIFSLSHGQAAVERGFSVNKCMLQENLQEQSLTAMRLVYDHMQDVFASQGISLHQYKILKELMSSCRKSHSKYLMYLEDEKKMTKLSEKDVKRKMIHEEIATVKRKKAEIESCITSLNKDVVKYSLEAEQKSDMSLLTRANSFRKTVEEKEKLAHLLNDAVKKLSEDLKDC